MLLVDNAAQPMQAAPVAALKGIAVSGNASKLHVIFTHFDQVKGDNLPGFSDREQHVLASVENVLKSIGDELGPAAERVLRRRIGRVLRPGARALIWDFRPSVRPHLFGPRHTHLPDPTDHTPSSPLQVVKVTPWPWPWPWRFTLTQRTELVRADGSPSLHPASWESVQR